MILSIFCLLFGSLQADEGDFAFPQSAEFFNTCPHVLKEKLGIREISVNKEVCTIYLVNQGSTDWTEISRLQGWNNIPLNEKGRSEAQKAGEQLFDQSISAIYSSTLQQALETAHIIQDKLENCPLYGDPHLKGEFHGKFEGYTKEQYTQEPHFRFYDSLPPEKEIFFPCGEGGESKVDMACRMAPVIKEICAAHLGERIVIVTHGGLFKLLNFYLGNYSEEEGTRSIPHGSIMVIQGDSQSLYLKIR